jgi:hypothetical protein
MVNKVLAGASFALCVLTIVLVSVSFNDVGWVRFEIGGTEFVYGLWRCVDCDDDAWEMTSWHCFQ